MAMFQLNVPVGLVPSPIPPIQYTGVTTGQPLFFNTYSGTVSNRLAVLNKDGTFAEYLGIFTNISSAYAQAVAVPPSATQVTGITFPAGLHGVGSITFPVNSFPSLTSLVGVDLISVTNISASTGIPLSTVSMPKLVVCSGSFQLNPASGGVISTLNFPSLKYVGGASSNFAIQGQTILTTISLPSLLSVHGTGSPSVLTISGNSALTSVDLSSLEFVSSTIGGTPIAISSNPSLTTVNIGNLKYLGIPTTSTISFVSNALSQASVDHILAVFAAMDGTSGKANFGTGKTLTLTGGTNATPSAAGLASKAIITGRGGNVTHN